MDSRAGRRSLERLDAGRTSPRALAARRARARWDLAQLDAADRPDPIAARMMRI
jgi:hypothetical protein